jgi:hypothetical protein
MLNKNFITASFPEKLHTGWRRYELGGPAYVSAGLQNTRSCFQVYNLKNYHLSLLI